MKILVDKMPNKPQACIFSKRDPIFGCYFCTLRCTDDNYYGSCSLEDGKKCRVLKEIGG